MKEIFSSFMELILIIKNFSEYKFKLSKANNIVDKIILRTERKE